MVEKLLKPAQFAEKQLLEGILEGRYKQGQTLPAERVLATELGVTRPTLRETLKRLFSQGWVIIQHGKPTRVNHYLENGGLGVLSALAQYGSHLPQELIGSLLEVRTVILPDIAQKAVHLHLDEILAYLNLSETMKDEASAYAEYDWTLQMKLVNATHNSVFRMIFNDFEPMYALLGELYFNSREMRLASLKYYRQLIIALENQDLEIRTIVENMMMQTQTAWEQMI